VYAWDPDKTNNDVTLSNGNRTMTATTGDNNQTAISNFTKSTGKWYWEIEVNNVDASGALESLGVCNQSGGTDFDKDSRTGWDESWGQINYDSPGRKYHAGGWANFGDPHDDGDILMLAVDIDNGRIWTGKNGTWYESGDPPAGTGYMFEDATMQVELGACCTLRVSGDQFTSRFEWDQMTYSPPVGFTTPDGEKIGTTTTTTTTCSSTTTTTTSPP